MLISCITQIRSFISLRLLCPFSSSSSSSSFFRAVLGHIQRTSFYADTIHRWQKDAKKDIFT